MAARTSYCDPTAVTGHLEVYMADLIASPAFGSREAVEGRIKTLQPITKGAIDRAAERDFDWHDAETVTLDGRGENTLWLDTLGIKPIASSGVTSITEDGVLVSADAYTVYESEGWIRKTSAYRAGGTWPEGSRNIVIVLSYGYETGADIPPEVVNAQAELIAASILGQCAGAGAGGGGVTGVTIGAFSVRYGSDHAWASIIRTWADDVKAVCSFYGRSTSL